MAALQAHTQMHPCVARLQAILAALTAWLHVLHMIFHVRALRRHPSPPPGNPAFTPYIVSPTRGIPPPAPLPMLHRVPVLPPAISPPAPPSPSPRAHSEIMPAFCAPARPPRSWPSPHPPPTPLRLRCRACPAAGAPPIPAFLLSAHELPPHPTHTRPADRHPHRHPPCTHESAKFSSGRPHRAAGQV